jgi:hypothetical protein
VNNITNAKQKDEGKRMIESNKGKREEVIKEK